MSTVKNKNSLRTIEAQIAQKLKNNEARPKFTGSHKKKSVYSEQLWSSLLIQSKLSQISVSIPGGGYFGVKRVGMTVGNPRKLP